MALDPDVFAQLLEVVRRFVKERLVPLEAKVAEEDAIPPALIQDMRELGLFGLSIGEDYGGLGLNMEEEVRVVFELGQASPAFRSIAGTNIGIGSQAIVLAGTDEQKQRFLPPLASGQIIGSFALTEPDAGSDAMSMRTSARREGDDYIINGTKRYITNAPLAGLFSVMVRTGDGQGADAISCFLVEAGTRGISLGKPDKKMGQAGALTCDVVFENCRVPRANLLGGEEGNGFRTAMKVLDKGRLHIAALCVGMAERLIRESVQFATTRKQFGKPISEFQLIQAMIADSQADTLAAKALVLETARARDRGERITLEAASAKMFASEMLGRVADRAVQIHGGAGYMAEYAVERFYRDARLFRIFEGTTQIQQLIIARETIKALS
jgi:acyl-CoA dehydrogenase